jgi:hypothetical protein
MHYFLQKNGLGYILGDFFTNAYGHPGLEACSFFSHFRLGRLMDDRTTNLPDLVGLIQLKETKT